MQVVNLSTVPGAAPPRIHVSQGDTGRQFKLVLYDPSAETITIPTDGTVSIAVSGTKPDNHAFSYTDTQTSVSDGNTITVTTTYQMTACSGDVECEIRVYYVKDPSLYSIYSANFIMDVEPACVPDDADLSASDIPKMQQVIDAMDKIDSLQETIDKGTELAEEIAADVTATRQNAEAAQTAETNAKTSASNAASSASSASSSASSAATSSSNAASSASSASNSASSASTSASNASSSASSAASSASNAKTYSEQTQSAVEKVATITQYTISSASWSSSVTEINGTYYYTYTISGVTIISEHPEFMITSSSKLPSEAEQTAFDLIKYMYAENSTLTFYAQNKPTTDVKILVRGVK